MLYMPSHTKAWTGHDYEQLKRAMLEALEKLICRNN